MDVTGYLVALAHTAVTAHTRLFMRLHKTPTRRTRDPSIISMSISFDQMLHLTQLILFLFNTPNINACTEISPAPVSYS